MRRPGRARRGAEMNDAGDPHRRRRRGRRGRIAAVDAPHVAARAISRRARDRLRQRVLMPGLVDSHTHGIFGRPRYEEQEMRAAGLDYMEIARRGGGIHSSVRDLRARSEDDLFDLARTRDRRGSRRSARRRSR